MKDLLVRSSMIRLGEKKRRGTVALSYLREPFLDRPKSAARGHTNWQECQAMAMAWRDRGYRVEIVDYRDRKYEPPKDTAVAIDIHSNLERWSPFLPPDCRKVLHATGAHWVAQNAAEYKRLEALRIRRAQALFPRRQVVPSRAGECADAITVLGNQFTLNTWTFAQKPVRRIPISSAVPCVWPEGREMEKARKRFLWLGSFGMVHKGLDLVLEAFASMPDLHLTVCGRPEKEADFFEAYKKELTGLPNIHLAGWVDQASAEFARICQTHVGIVYPSCSEGGGGAVIHAMAGGLLPIATVEASVDLGDFGESISTPDPEGVAAAVRRVSESSPAFLEQRARQGWEHVQRHHSLETFCRSYASFVDEFDPA